MSTLRPTASSRFVIHFSLLKSRLSFAQLHFLLASLSAFLVRYLEQRSCELSLDRVELTFVVTSLTQVGVTLPRLLEIYDRLHAAKVSGSVQHVSCVMLLKCNFGL